MRVIPSVGLRNFITKLIMFFNKRGVSFFFSSLILNRYSKLFVALSCVFLPSKIDSLYLISSTSLRHRLCQIVNITRRFLENDGIPVSYRFQIDFIV